MQLYAGIDLHASNNYPGQTHVIGLDKRDRSVQYFLDKYHSKEGGTWKK